MTQTNTITCDSCEADLTYTNYIAEYGIVLSSFSKAPWYQKDGLSGGAVFSMATQNPLPKSKHFCGKVCLKKWIDNWT